MAGAAVKDRILSRLRDVSATSRTARWYTLATGLIPHTTKVPRREWTNLHHIRMGYVTRCYCILKEASEECQHCGNRTEEPLIHYLQEC
ncbi:hypothetical protein Pmani_002304 [Petrolisthes manimaculis]|uniref:Uncharacterized protein n=1 Tax=Petrolisthes manimaculis TaxID=1843537 RepID=A0AAE1QKK7_9EUCA|nr:hypothetical protein Pmani_002304 [Petrolisthes manimaculis]